MLESRDGVDDVVGGGGGVEEQEEDWGWDCVAGPLDADPRSYFRSWAFRGGRCEISYSNVWAGGVVGWAVRASAACSLCVPARLPTYLGTYLLIYRSIDGDFRTAYRFVSYHLRTRAPLSLCLSLFLTSLRFI